MTRRLTGDEKLLRAIARAIKRASCASTSIVESLIEQLRASRWTGARTTAESFAGSPTTCTTAPRT